MKVTTRTLALGVLSLAASPTEASDFLNKLKHPFSSLSSKANLTHLPSLPEPQSKENSSLPTVEDLVELQLESIQDAKEVNLRHRLLGEAGQVKSAFNLNLCADMHYGNKDLYLYECHSNNNQKHRWDGNTQRIYVEGLCWDDDLRADRNVYASGCHNGNNQKWWFDKQGRIHGKHDDRCIEVVGSSFKMRKCSDSEKQRLIFPRDFPVPKSKIKPFYDQNNCWDIGGGPDNKNLYVGSCHNGDNQDFYYSPSRQHIYVGHGKGCMDEDSKGNVYA